MGVSQYLPKSLLVFSLALPLALVGCSSGQTDTSSENLGSPEAQKTVEVFAAASMNAVGVELEKAYEKVNPEATVHFNYAGSSKLVQQIEQGATPDLLITADQTTMDGAVSKLDQLSGVKDEVIATNQLVLVTVDGNPGKIESVKDLASDKVITAICAEEVPCGKLAHQELDKQEVALGNATEEKNVSGVSTKLASGAVAAGFIYSTDAATLQKNQEVTVIELPDLPANSYSMAITKQGATNETAKDFSQWLKSQEAQEILGKYHFGPAK